MHRALPLVFLLACEPPPAADAGTDTDTDTDTTPVVEEPSIRILFPENDVTIPLSSTCELVMTVVVDVDNLEVVEASPPTVDGQGHWHFRLSETDYHPSFGDFAQVTAFTAFAPGQLVSARATLQDNEHNDLDMFENWDDNLEFTVGPPEDTAVTCP